MQQEVNCTAEVFHDDPITGGGAERWKRQGEGERERGREVGVPLFLYCADVALGKCSVVQSLHCFLSPPTFPTLLFSFFVFFPQRLDNWTFYTFWAGVCVDLYRSPL